MAEFNYLNMQVITSQFRGMEELIKPTLEDFVGEYKNYLANIRQALNAHDAKALNRHAHTFKGTLANFQVKPAIELALQLEKQGAKNDFTNAEELFAKLTSIVDSLIIEINSYLKNS